MKRVIAAALVLGASGAAGRDAPPAPAWRTLPTDAYPGKRDDLSFADARHGWYGTGKGDLYATNDAGATWRKVASKPGTFISALGFVDARTGFIGNVGTGYYPGVTDPVPLHRTDDGGATWVPVELGAAKVAGICTIDILRTRRIYQGRLVPQTTITAAGRVGEPAAIIRSTDGGATWRVIDMARSTGMILDIYFVDDQTGFVAASLTGDVNTTSAQVLMTRDGGATWREVYHANRLNELIWKLSFPTPLIGYGTVMSYDVGNPHRIIIKTVDGGLTWQERSLVENAKAVEFGIGFADARHGWVGTTVGGFETRDGGATFTPAAIVPAANKFRVVAGEGGGRSVYAIGTAA